MYIIGRLNPYYVPYVSECWRFYAVPTAMVIFTAKACLDVFSLSREQVWTFSVLGGQIYEMRCPFVVVGLNACFIVLRHWDNMSQAHMLTHPVTLYGHRADQLCFVVCAICDVLTIFVYLHTCPGWCKNFPRIPRTKILEIKWSVSIV